MNRASQNVGKEHPGNPAAPEPIHSINNSETKGCGKVVGRSKATNWWGKWQVLIPAGSFTILVAGVVVAMAQRTDPEKMATKEYVATSLQTSETKLRADLATKESVANLKESLDKTAKKCDETVDTMNRLIGKIDERMPRRGGEQ